jgi:hypothetical protein
MSRYEMGLFLEGGRKAIRAAWLIAGQSFSSHELVLPMKARLGGLS